MLLDPPRTLPVSNLSVNAIRLYLQCPEKWRRRYIDNAWEPSSGAALVGKAVGAAEATNYQQKIETGLDLPADDVLDEFADQFELGQERDEIDWREDKPGEVKDSGANVLKVYHRVVAPKVTPTHVERKVNVALPDVDWGFVGYLDLEDSEGAIDDLKVRGASKGIVKAEEAASDLQPTGYLFARRAEQNPATGFRYHSLVRARAPELKHVALTPTSRNDEQLDGFQDLLYRIAAEINWRLEYDVWTGAPPGAWWCSEKWCGHWHDCQFGGKYRSPVALPVATGAAA